MSWRSTLVSLHRDVGFFCVGLTIVYAVSGVAVNHREDWDYNYSVDTTTRRVGKPADLLGGEARDAEAVAPGELARREQEALVRRLLAKLGREDEPRAVMWRGPDRLTLFFGEGDRDVVDYLPSSGKVEHETKSERFLIRQFNVLHLNEGRGVWTWIADAFAVVLLFLAITGAIVVRGRLGLKGRGGWLLAAGIALPAIALLLIG